MRLGIDTRGLAVTFALTATIAGIGIYVDLQTRIFGQYPQERSYRADSVTPGASAPPGQNANDNPRCQGCNKGGDALHPHIHLVEGIAAIVLGYHGQTIVGQLIKGREDGSHNPAVGAVGSNQSYNPSQIGGQQETRQSQNGGPEDALLFGITVLVFFLPEPADNILHHTQGADDRAVDTAKQQCQGHNKEQGPDVHGNQSGQELNLGHPSQIQMCCAGKVNQQPRNQNPENEGKSDSDFSKHKK